MSTTQSYSILELRDLYDILAIKARDENKILIIDVKVTFLLYADFEVEKISHYKISRSKYVI